MEKRIIITGGSGFLGSKIAEELLVRGYEVVSVDIVPPRNPNVQFVYANIADAIPLDAKLEHPEAIINLAGVPIFGRWTKAYKQSIYDSRVLGTKKLVVLCAQEQYRPKRLVSASAVGFYGNTGDAVIPANAPAGTNFLATVAQDWERAAQDAVQYGVETTVIRNGHILGNGGLLGVLLPWYKAGLGGPIGSGKQYMPWIHIDDCVALYVRAAIGELHEPVIVAVSPQQITNAQFSQAVARTLHRPHLFFIPITALRLMYGDLGIEMSYGQRVEASLGDYTLQYPEISGALAEVL